jgi:DNA-binding NtrC family response regulator
LFRKFVIDFAEKYKTTPVQLDDEAKALLINYPWKGNVRELKNIAEQISVLTTEKLISAKQLRQFLPEANMNRLPVLASSVNGSASHHEFANEREILYKLFFDMKKDVTELKKMFVEILQNPSTSNAAVAFARDSLLHEYNPPRDNEYQSHQPAAIPSNVISHPQPVIFDDIHHHEEVEESLNIMDKEKELIIKALKKHKGKRKDAASDLGISERTLYRKLKEYDIDE